MESRPRCFSPFSLCPLYPPGGNISFISVSPTMEIGEWHEALRRILPMSTTAAS